MSFVKTSNERSAPKNERGSDPKRPVRNWLPLTGDLWLQRWPYGNCHTL